MKKRLILAALAATTATYAQIEVNVPAANAATIGSVRSSATDIVQNKEMVPAQETAFPAKTDDLINAGSPFLANSTHENYTNFQSARISALNDGSVDGGQNALAFDLDGNWTSTFWFDLQKSANGYDIMEIRSIAGWKKNRADQKYELFYATVAAPETFISLGIFEYAIGSDGSSQITLSKKDAPIVAKAAALKFVFMKGAATASETAYREIDVMGQPTK